MPHNRNKQCLDDSIMVDTSSAYLPGCRTSGVSSCATNITPTTTSALFVWAVL
jgi:hypothetical protein